MKPGEKHNQEFNQNQNPELIPNLEIIQNPKPTQKAGATPERGNKPEPERGTKPDLNLN